MRIIRPIHHPLQLTPPLAPLQHLQLLPIHQILPSHPITSLKRRFRNPLPVFSLQLRLLSIRHPQVTLLLQSQQLSRAPVALRCQRHRRLLHLPLPCRLIGRTLLLRHCTAHQQQAGKGYLKKFRQHHLLLKPMFKQQINHTPFHSRHKPPPPNFQVASPANPL